MSRLENDVRPLVLQNQGSIRRTKVAILDTGAHLASGSGQSGPPDGSQYPTFHYSGDHGSFPGHETDPNQSFPTIGHTQNHDPDANQGPGTSFTSEINRSQMRPTVAYSSKFSA